MRMKMQKPLLSRADDTLFISILTLFIDIIYRHTGLKTFTENTHATPQQ